MKALILFLLSFDISWGQLEVLGGWEGRITVANPFGFNVLLDASDERDVFVELQGNKSITRIGLSAGSDGILRGSFENQLRVSVDLEGAEPIVFFQINHHLCAIALQSDRQNVWQGKWQLLLGQAPPYTLLLSLDSNSDSSLYASIFFKEPTFHYMLAEQFRIEENRISFVDLRSQIHFEGTLGDQVIHMRLRFLNEELFLDMRPSDRRQWALGKGSGASYSEVADSRFERLVRDIESDTLERTHAVVISEEDSIVFEHYFDDFAKDVLHDTRSAAKSFASAIVGIAIDERLLPHEFLDIKSFYEDKYSEIDWTGQKDKVNLFHLMTMSSGMDAIDFGLNRTSFANEGNYQRQNDWTKHILQAPMVKAPGSEGNYGSGSPHLIGPIIDNLLESKLEFYMHRRLFRPLGITNYRIQLTNESRPYFGGGWYLRPVDLVRFGQLYLNNGIHKEEQIIPGQWVEKSMERHVVLENTFDKNPYGYLFWHKDYWFGDKSFASVEARGAGGQYIFIVPKLKLVVAILSGNYTNNKAFQPERIFREYILPHVLN
ncbi:MAG: serine hydrolase [Saprospiraceae bacterium]|nr:serine hydrolase [Saprospiraceae bacterium]